jgi:addiction module HigA family antidote
VASDTTPQDRAVEALVAKFKGDYVRSGFSPEDPRDYSTLVPRVENGETGLSSLTFGEIVDCLAEAGLLFSDAAAPFNPDWSIHPGEFLREELHARGLTQLACAEMVGRSVQVINLIVNGKKGITPDTALDLERGLGVSAGFWVRLQAEHDLAVARQRRPAGGDAHGG